MTFPELLKTTRQATMEQIVCAAPDDIRELLERATVLFDSYHFISQTTAMAMMLAMLLATYEGESCTAEGEMGVIITSKHRLALFITQYQAVFQECMHVRAQHPDAHPFPKKTVN